MYMTGDRVVCIKDYFDSVFYGETGTVVDQDHSLVYVRWDKYRKIRHSRDGRCKRSHGWNVPEEFLDCENKVFDLGILPHLNIDGLF